MASWNSEWVHHVQTGDNAIFQQMVTVDIPVEYVEKAPWLCSDKKTALEGSNGHIDTQLQDVILPAGSDGKFWFLYLLVNKLLKFMPKPKSLFGLAYEILLVSYQQARSGGAGGLWGNTQQQ